MSSINSTGSSQSFWQQDQNFWSRSQSESNSLAATTTVINAIANAETTQAAGLASIANQTALNRVNSEITSLVQQVLKGASGTSSSSTTASSTASTSSSGSANTSSAAVATPSPSTLTGTSVLTTGTSLASLGILQDGTITVSAGTNATTYTSTGTDTVGNLISAINVDLPTNAQVTASLDATGHLVVTSRNNKDSIAVVGSGTDAAAIGFGAKNSAAQPTTPSSKTSGTATGSSTSSSSSASSSSSSSASSSANLSTEYTKALAQANDISAQSILSASGVNGTLLNLLA